MNRPFVGAGEWIRLRPLVLVVLAILLGAGCGSDNSSPVAVSDAPDSPAIGSPAAVPVDSSTSVAAVTYVGIPVGPFGLWTMNKIEYGPAPFTGSHNFINADTLVLQINAARNKGHRLIVAMAGGPSSRYVTSGQFDLAKWKAVMNTYNKSSLKTAVAAAVTDGTLIGNMLIDEPETKQWGTTLTKAKIDQMAAYSKTIFPTLRVGVNHGPPAYKWRSTEIYTKVDYVVYQYAHWVTQGNITSWRDAVLARAQVDHVTPAFSLNVLNGGKQDRGDGYYDCVGASMGGLGTRYPNCKMTVDQIRTWGKTLAPLGCAMLLWQFDRAYFTKSTVLSAFTDIKNLAASKPKRTCKRV